MLTTQNIGGKVGYIRQNCPKYAVPESTRHFHSIYGMGISLGQEINYRIRKKSQEPPNGKRMWNARENARRALEKVAESMKRFYDLCRGQAHNCWMSIVFGLIAQTSTHCRPE